jgi:retron-type reverse transcriptase
MGISKTERACIVMTSTSNLFEKMTSLEHLFQSWKEFRRGKRKRKDIQLFERRLEDNIFQLQEDLVSFQYFHAPYHQFYVTDPKQRHISKAIVRDRLIHQALFSVLNEILDKKFFFHSLSSRKGKGTHVGITQLRQMIRKMSANGTAPLIPSIQSFLMENLKLELHPKKVVIQKLTQGIDFVGYVLFHRHVLLRTRTKRRLKKKLKEAYELYQMSKISAQSMNQKLQSYLGILSHANQHELATVLKNAYWIRNEKGKIPS